MANTQQTPKQDTHTNSKGENVFSKLNSLKLNAIRDDRAYELYLEYNNRFSKRERDIIEFYRKEYNSSKDVLFIEKLDEEAQKVIFDFIEWSEGLPSDKVPLLWYRFKNWVKKTFCRHKKQQKSNTESIQAIDPSKPIDINEYINTRVQNQINYFDKKSSESQTHYRRIQRAIIILSAASTLILSLHFNGVLDLCPNPEKQAEEERCKLFDNYKDCYNILQENRSVLTGKDTTIFEVLPNPWTIEEQKWNMLYDYYKKSYKTLQNIRQNIQETTNIDSLPKPTELKESPQNKWWVFVQNIDIEKGLGALFSFIIVMITGFDKLMKHYDKWHRNRENCEKLKRELYSYYYNVDIYRNKEKNKKDGIFVARVETIINDYVRDMLNEKNKIIHEHAQELTEQNKNGNTDPKSLISEEQVKNIIEQYLKEHK